MILKLMIVLLFVSGCLKNDQDSKATDHKVKDYLSKYGLSEETFKKMDPTQAVMLANALVYKHCKNEAPHESKTINLFENCRTACGGFSYVLVETLKHLNFKPRYVNLYNILNQGNHSLVEVEVKGKQALLDPTFGTVFVKGDELLSLSEVLSHKEDDLKKIVMQVKNRGFSSQNINEIYHNEFYAQFMSLKSYLSFETYNVHDGRFVNLKLQLDLKDKTISEWKLPPGLSLDEKNSEFLKKTNETLNNSITGDEVSYNFSLMGGKESVFRNTIKITNLKKYQRYKLSLEGDVTSEGDISLSIVDGKAAISEGLYTANKKGSFNADFDFTPISNDLLILIEPNFKSAYKGRLWNVSVEQIKI